jgi:hypothetical protein
MAPKPFNLGDACPRCGGTMVKLRVPTDAEFAAAFDKENPTGLPEFTDTANTATRAESGALYECDRCAMHYRFLEPAPAAASGKSKSAA